MSKEYSIIERSMKFIEDYEKLLTQPTLSNGTRERAEKDVEAMKEVISYAMLYITQSSEDDVQ